MAPRLAASRSRRIRGSSTRFATYPFRMGNRTYALIENDLCDQLDTELV
jgi:hypothetical protein